MQTGLERSKAPPRDAGAKGAEGRHLPGQGSSPVSGDPSGESLIMSAGHLSTHQMMFLLVFVYAGKLLFMFPALMSGRVGSSAWIASTLAVGVELLGVWGWILWAKATGTEGFVPSVRRSLGRIAGDAVVFFVIAVFILLEAMNIRMFSSGAVIGLLPEYPVSVIIAISIISSLYAAWLGPETVGRAAGLLVVPSLLSVAVVILGMLQSFHFDNVLPIWGLGFKTTLLQGILAGGAFAGGPMVGVMKSYVRDSREFPRRAILSIVVGGLALVVGIFSLEAIFPYPMVSRTIEPLGILARSVSLGRFLQRLEAVFVFSWFFAANIQASFLSVLTLLLMSQLCNTETYRPFIPSLATLTFGIASIPANTLRSAQILDAYLTHGAGYVLLVLGWVLYGMAKMRGAALAGHVVDIGQRGNREASR